MKQVPFGYCHCGCGSKTNIARHTINKLGQTDGQPLRYLRGHTGKDLHAKKIKPPLADEMRFWKYVDRASDSDCWLWNGAKSNGYGLVYFHGKYQKTHRISYEMAHGPIPDGLIVLHSCDNRACVNPNHLSTGTNNDNSKDMVAKNRQAKGSRVGPSKLHEDDVVVIRQRAASGDKPKHIAADYGLNVDYLYNILSRKQWKHVP